jgi:glycosyltransferase involved in cell wall biosynthesis
MTKRIGLIICYNHEGTIAQSIDSFLAQELKLDKIIVVDDCSVDNSVQQIKTLITRYSNVELYITPHNSGPSNSLNFGIEKITKDYSDTTIYFLSGDDLSLSSRTSVQNHLFESMPKIELLLGNIVSVDYVPNNSYESLAQCLPVRSGKVEVSDLFFHLNNYCASSMALKLQRGRKIPRFNSKSIYLQDFEIYLDYSWDNKIFYNSTKIVQYSESPKTLSREIFHGQTDLKFNKMNQELSTLYRNFFTDKSKSKILEHFPKFSSNILGIDRNDRNGLIRNLYLSHSLPEIRLLAKDI